MKKKILSLALILMLICVMFVLTGCGSDEESSSAEESSESSDNSKATSGVLADIITAENYGDTINYSANGIDDWKIFYNDGENIFIISTNQIASSKLSSTLGLDTKASRYGGNVIYWDWDEEEFLKYSGISSIDKTIAEKFQLKWIETNTEDTDNLNMKVIASMLDQSNWSDFINTEYADYATGGPTLEMWVASWNEKGYTQIYYDEGENGYGYYVGTDESSLSTSVSLGDEIKEDSLYYVDGSTDSSGYWLASPGDKGDDRVMHITSSLGGGDPFSVGTGLRVLVCLKSSATATKNDEGIWVLE